MIHEGTAIFLVGAFVLLAAACELIVESYCSEAALILLIRVVTLALMLAVAWCVVSLVNGAHARDLDGRYAQSPLKQWFDGLRSGKGPCCSDADGSAVSDADWESRNGHYRVRIQNKSVLGDPMEWFDVPDDAVITEPNRAGRTMVWPVYGYEGTKIRCFMPGSMT